ncbi:hypothetical protein HYQ44_001522 [Verticillium longisporum]|nr:hypothetical protein HYQ44_001522 [Verticillium longisporum]
MTLHRPRPNSIATTHYQRRTQAIYAFYPPTGPLYLILINTGSSRTPARDRLTVVAPHTTSTLLHLK